jgi:HSP20 family molecular chaperone IbpA
METATGAEIQARKKAEVQSPAEQTRPGLLFTPAVDIFETEKDISLLADMPGVKADDLSIDLKDNTLTILGKVESPKKSDEVDIVMEYRTGNFFRQFTLSEMIDQGKIEANLKDGVLRLVLPKVEKATPRKITVTIT